jgi:hypothetical protein
LTSWDFMEFPVDQTVGGDGLENLWVLPMHLGTAQG